MASTYKIQENKLILVKKIIVPNHINNKYCSRISTLCMVYLLPTLILYSLYSNIISLVFVGKLEYV